MELRSRGRARATKPQESTGPGHLGDAELGQVAWQGSSSLHQVTQVWGPWSGLRTARDQQWVSDNTLLRAGPVVWCEEAGSHVADQSSSPGPAA